MIAPPPLASASRTRLSTLPSQLLQLFHVKIIPQQCLIDQESICIERDPFFIQQLQLRILVLAAGCFLPVTLVSANELFNQYWNSHTNNDKRTPVLAIHRWHGTSGQNGLTRSAPPTARGELFRAFEMAAYVVTRPSGII